MEKVVHLISSGLDSPVAAYILVKNGVEPIFLFFDANPFNTERTKQAALKLARKIATYAGKNLKMYICPHGDTIKKFHEIAEKRDLDYTCIFCKRIYYRVAMRIAIKEGAQAISSGEIIGEQASQTIDNLAVIQESIGNFLIVRPVLTMDKLEVMNIGREIGTYEISTEAKDGCQAVPKWPMTHAKLENYKKIEDRLDIDEIISSVLESAEIIEITPSGE
ncbi:MAG: hypothetical protein ACFFCS_19655 [Candidatus Hodarchaeota archaeon]